MQIELCRRTCERNGASRRFCRENVTFKKPGANALPLTCLATYAGLLTSVLGMMPSIAINGDFASNPQARKSSPTVWFDEPQCRATLHHGCVPFYIVNACVAKFVRICTVSHSASEISRFGLRNAS